MRLKWSVLNSFDKSPVFCSLCQVPDHWFTGLTTFLSRWSLSSAKWSHLRSELLKCGKYLLLGPGQIPTILIGCLDPAPGQHVLCVWAAAALWGLHWRDPRLWRGQPQVSQDRPRRVQKLLTDKLSEHQVSYPVRDLKFKYLLPCFHSQDDFLNLLLNLRDAHDQRDYQGEHPAQYNKHRHNYNYDRKIKKLDIEDWVYPLS